MNYEVKHLMSRKIFLRLITQFASIAVASKFLQACNQNGLIENIPEMTPKGILPSYTPSTISVETNTPSSPTQTPPAEVTELSMPSPNMPPTNIALIKTNNRTQGIRQALKLINFNPGQGKNFFLKPNFNSADPYPGSTHPDTLRSLVVIFQELDARKITVGDRSGMGNTQAVMKSLGVFELTQELGFDTINFDDLGLEDWKQIPASGTHWKEGFLIAESLLESDVLVQTCNLKTHRFGGIFTLSLKNSVGMIAKTHPTSGYQYMSELHSSPNQRKMIAEINAVYEPDLVVLDGIKAFTSGGPETGTLASPGVILAGTDRIAIDAMGVAILRINGASFEGAIFQQEQIERAIELNLGIKSPDQINILTQDSQSAELAQQIMQTIRDT